MSLRSLRRRQSFNGVIFFLIFILVGLLVAGIVTRRPVFYILDGIILFFIILSVVLLFNFLKKTGQETSSTRRSTYDILEGREIKGLKVEKEEFLVGLNLTLFLIVLLWETPLQK